jgi:hypothetical protein
VTVQDDAWLPLADGPLAAIVSELETATPELTEGLDSLEKLLAFRTFAAIRVGIVLGRLLMENEVEAYDGSETWVEGLVRNHEHREAIAAEVRAVAEELERIEVPEGTAPDDAMRDRFRAFVRREVT